MRLASALRGYKLVTATYGPFLLFAFGFRPTAATASGSASLRLGLGLFACGCTGLNQRLGELLHGLHLLLTLDAGTIDFIVRFPFRFFRRSLLRLLHHDPLDLLFFIEEVG